MSCRACGIPISCLDIDGNPSSDVSPSGGFFATQGFTFVLDCPKGFICANGYYPNPVIIPPGDIPGVNDGPQMCIQGCLSLVCVTPLPGASQSDKQALANFLFYQWSQQEAVCRNRTRQPRPGVTPPRFVTIGEVKPISIYNTKQVYTAHCNPDTSGDPKTATVPAGYIGETILQPTPALIAQIQAEMNSVALGKAVNDANALLTCGVCNAQLHAFSSCPGDPTKIASITIPAGTYCQPIGTDQRVVDAQASIALNNAITASLTAQACPCPGPTIAVNGTISSPCPFFVTWNLNSPTGPIGVGGGFGSFNPEVQYCNFNAAGYPCTHGPLYSDLFSGAFANSHLFQFFPAHP